ncbi:MAG: menaquinone biosynthesis protein [Firmicutes bacterium]|nr:menaquinone biosynthesis protein [Bacillota bacterium]
MRPRVGHIQFLNSLPLYYGLVKNDVLLDVDLVKGTPTELNRYLLEGSLDISSISSIEYARHHEELILMPNISVSADGEVKSIYLFSKVPIEQLDGQPVALTSTSATSQALLQIIMRDKYGIKPRYFVSPPELGSMLLEAEAALLIGDHAMRAAYQLKERLFVYDLGLEWKTLTGLGMVFAVWAIRKEFATAQPDLAREVYHAFFKSMDYSLRNITAVAENAARWEPFAMEYLCDYFQTLRFSFGPNLQAGLLEYYRRAQTLGILKTVPEIKFLEV